MPVTAGGTAIASAQPWRPTLQHAGLRVPASPGGGLTSAVSAHTTNNHNRNKGNTPKKGYAVGRGWVVTREWVVSQEVKK